MVLPKPDASETADSKSNIVIPKISDINKNANNSVIKKVPVLKITINKKYNKPCTSNLDTNKDATNFVNNVDVIHNTTSSLLVYNVHKTEKSNTNEEMKSDLIHQIQNRTSSLEPVVFNLIPVVFKEATKNKNATVKIKNICTSKSKYTRKGDLSRDHSRYQTSSERIRYLYTKAQRDCDILKIRLKALKERHKQEQEEVRKLQIHLGDLCKNVTEESFNGTSEERSNRKRSSVSLEDTEEEDEYEILLKKVRKIKQDVLNPKYSVITSNQKLEEINEFHYEKNEFNKEYESFITNGEIIDEIDNDSTEITEDFHEESSGDSNIESEEEYLETVMNT